ncbi:MAG: outer membrane beta-barrel protein [Bacteroidetes bacterium]|nr:outer membrane beta-barrel protein [Bacteroidota bacterium]
MKKLLLIAIVILISSSWNISNAQVRAGFKMGCDFSKMKLTPGDGYTSQAPDFKRLISPRIGFIIEVGLTENLFLQGGVFGSAKGVRYDSVREISKKEYDSKEYEIILGIDVPINFGYKYDLGGAKLFAMAGPVLTYGLYCTNLYKADDEYDNDHQTFGNNITNDFRALNIGINVEGGVEVDRFQFTVFYTQGISNISPVSEIVIAKTNVFGFTAAIKFGSID